MKQIQQRGFGYVKRSIIIWNIRFDKLIISFGKADSENDLVRRDRIFRISNKLYDRIRELLRIYNRMKIEYEHKKREMDEMYVMLECPDMLCRYKPGSVITGVKMKDYEPGKLKCELCGSELITKEDRGTNEMLWDVLGRTR